MAFQLISQPEFLISSGHAKLAAGYAMGKTIENRKSFRMPFRTEVTWSANGRNHNGFIRDLSIMGFYMETEDSPQVASEGDIEIVLNGDYSRLVMDKLRGKVVRGDETGIGVQFDKRLEWVALVPIYFPKLKR